MCSFNRGNVHFYEEDRIRCLAFNFEIRSYKIILELFYISPGFSRNTTSPNFTSIFKMIWVRRVSKRGVFCYHIAKGPIYNCSQAHNKLSTLHLSFSQCHSSNWTCDEYRFLKICIETLPQSYYCHIQKYLM